MALTEDEHDAGYALICQARCEEDLIIEPCAQGISFPDTVHVTASVSSVEPLTEGITRLVIQLPDGAPVEYLAGQYMNFVLPDASTRSFSMACAKPVDGKLDFHIRSIAGGLFTTSILPNLKPKDPLRMEIPLGMFCFRPDDWRPMIMAATGTGIAPIRAILESLLDTQDCPPITLYWGMRSESDLYAAREIESWAGRLYEFKFIPVLSRPDSQWTGRCGYVQDAILEDYDDLSEYAFYLCGSPDMIAQSKTAFCEKGAEIAFIYSDSFTFSGQVASI